MVISTPDTNTRGCMKILYKTWISNKDGTVGMVVTENMMGERKIRCGGAFNESEDSDLQQIVNWGATVSVTDLQNMVNLVLKK
jgi:hypothetical protein